MTLDEAIEQFKYDAECNRADLDLSYAEDNEQVAEWLEELKVYQQHKIICNKGYNAGYNKALNDFVNVCKSNSLCQTFGLRQCDIEYMAERLKVGVTND